MAKEVIRVVAAVIEHDGRYLITQRNANAVLPMLWEFPGGRVEAGENEAAALEREVRGRIGVDVIVGAKLGEHLHEYTTYQVQLTMYACQLPAEARPHPATVADLRWVTSREFLDYDFPPADEKTMSKLLGLVRNLEPRVTPVRSLGLATELALAATRGVVEDRGDYLVVRTPDDPGYYYGNLLVLPAAPQVGEVAFWSRRFADELGGDPAIRHVTFTWDGTSGDPGAEAELRAAGFTIDVTETMVARDAGAERAAESAAPAYGARPPAPALPIRALTAEEVLDTADLAFLVGDRHDETYRRFLHRRARWHRDLVTRGLARFFAAHDGDLLVASCGLVSVTALGRPVARYQDVQTAEAYRHRGLASALLTACAAALPIGERVIVAQPASAGARVYARAGFRTVERCASACRYPAEAPAT